MNEKVSKAVEVLNRGGLVIMPSDTAWGISCRIDNEEALRRLFAAKKRSLSQPVIVYVTGREMAQEYLQPLSEKVKELMQTYWPGALTIVYPANKEKTSPLVLGETDNLGVRMPNYSMLLDIVSAVGVPIVGTSANFHGEKTPQTQSDLDPEFVKLVDAVIPGPDGSGTASTVLDCSTEPWKVLRQGTVTIDK